MQITHCEVIPLELKLARPLTTAAIHGGPPQRLEAVTAIFVRLEIRGGRQAWGCSVVHPLLTGCGPAPAIRLCRELAARAVDLHPLNLEYSLAELTAAAQAIAAQSHHSGESTAEANDAALCAFDLAFHDLLALAAGLPLYRLLGGFRSSIQTSITIPVGDVAEGVEEAERRAAQGFRIIKLKGGMDPALDVARVRAVQRALPDIALRLDADGGYDVTAALEVARALEGRIEMLEQPTPPDDLNALREVSRHSPMPVLADQSACGPDSALRIAADRCAHGLAVKPAACGGLLPARRVEAIARAARLSVMAACLVEPALLIAAGLSLALASPTVRYADLDGHLHLADDPSLPGFSLEDGKLTAADVPGLGYSVNLG